MSKHKPRQDKRDDPFSQFNFLVDLGDGRQGGFQEMSGLDQGSMAVEYRTSTSPAFFSRVKMPGLVPLGLVTLKRGLMIGGDAFGDWREAVLLGRVEPRTIRIRQRDERHQPVLTWTLTGARPTKLVGGGSDKGAAEVAIESLEIACERIAGAEG